MFSLKGASGSKFCPHCLNVTNKVQLPDDIPAVGLDDPNTRRFDRCTDRLFDGMLNSIQCLRDAGNVRQLLDAEIDYGTQCERHSMFVDLLSQ